MTIIHKIGNRDYSTWLNASEFMPAPGTWIRALEYSSAEPGKEYEQIGKWLHDDCANLLVMRGGSRTCRPRYWKPLTDDEIAVINREWDERSYHIPPKVIGKDDALARLKEML